MWLFAPLVFVLLQPAAGGKLELTNVRATYGALGGNRPDFTMLPGDLLHMAFDIVGLQPDAQGRLRYGTSLEVEDAKGKTIFKDDFGEVPAVIVNLLGGNRVPHSVMINTGLDQTPGVYRAKVTVREYPSKKEAMFSKEFTVNQPDFGIVRVQLFYDLLSQVAAPPVGVVGQKLFLNFVPVHFKYDTKQEGAVNVELNVLDDRGNATPVRPLSGQYSKIPSDATWLQLRFEIPLQRSGQFKLALKATDQVSKKTATLTIPLQVVEAR